jgi:hypothetical protein
MSREQGIDEPFTGKNWLEQRGRMGSEMLGGRGLSVGCKLWASEVGALPAAGDNLI